jgi:hypothetical protein
VGPFRWLYLAVFVAIAAVFALCAVALLVLAVATFLPAAMPGDAGLRPRSSPCSRRSAS